MRKVALVFVLSLSFGWFPLLACDLSPLHFEEGEWSDAVASVLPVGERRIGEELRITRMEIGFSPARYEAWAGGEVVDVLLSATVDAQQLITSWRREATERAHARGCGTRTQWAKDFTWRVVHNRDVEGKFRVQHEEWSCGKIPIINKTWKNKNAQFDATVWQTFMPRVRNGGDELRIEFSGRYKDNVPDKLIDLIKFFANTASVEPILSEVAHLDESIFSRLKQYRDVIEEIERFRVLGSGVAGVIPVDGQGSKVSLDLVFSNARFEKNGNRLALAMELRSREGRAILPSQACLLKEGLEKARLQGQAIGPGGRNHVVARGENAWSIARESYGDGRYFQLVAAANNLDDPSTLREGQQLRLEPLANFLARNEVVVLSSGDSLWKISSAQAGGRGTFSEILSANDSLSNPDLVYPVQVIRSGSGGASAAGGQQ